MCAGPSAAFCSRPPGMRRGGRRASAWCRERVASSSHTVDPASLPPWLSERDIDFYAAEFARTGFRGGLNWYRNIDRSWELLAPFAGAQVTVPALYVAGDRDLVVTFKGMDQLIPNLAKLVPNLRGTIMLPGCGHWTQQERAGRGERGHHRLPWRALSSAFARVGRMQRRNHLRSKLRRDIADGGG